MRQIYNLQFTIYKIIGFALFFYILHFTFYIPSYAEQPCNLRVQCWDGSPKIQECTGVWDGTNGRCDVSEPIGICGECFEPSSQPQIPETPQTPPSAGATTNPSTPNTPPVSNPQPPAAESSLPSKEESAVYKTFQATSPQQTAKPESEPTLIQKLVEALQSLSGLFVEPLRQSTISKFSSQSDSLSQGSLPQEVRPKEEADVVSKLKGWLGGKSGTYGKALPPVEGVTDDVKSYEDLYQKGYYPEGANPIIPNTPTPTPKNNLF